MQVAIPLGEPIKIKKEATFKNILQSAILYSPQGLSNHIAL
jgi:hypothetical protein